MNELIIVTYNEKDEPTVMGRDLHSALEVRTAYKDWFPRMCEYGFVEGRDFNLLKNERVQIEGDRSVSREIVDHELTIDMAKEICMIQRTEKGKQVRQYFLELEREWNSPEAVMARAMKMADRTIASLHHKVSALTEANTALLKLTTDNAPKVAFADSVSETGGEILIGELAKLMHQNGIDIGQNRLYRELREDGYIMQNGTIPTQKGMEKGWFRIIERPVTIGNGKTILTQTTKVTVKGQVDLINKFYEKHIDDIF